ncbi:DUF4097 family beta strand repeat-containing protein [Labedaea rhizosphaerae]|uniref:Putative adhesin n=1 Tax=Labedaea rhizosphaerae TaxID=598644 RepID=A0A4R6S9Y0_LABRH|nr:DUF4097 family beta strand repeat-containing protein [Labedaea rhizosphaerae]TDP96742.1 putative adhesin [Labedaea rhizosphaerae]
MSTFLTPEPIIAKLTTGGARVRITASERQDTEVRVEPVDSTNATDVKVAAKTKVEFAAGELTIETVKAGAKDGSVAITVELPVGSQLVLNTAWSQVHAAGRLGDCTLAVASGRVELGHIGALRGDLADGELAVEHIAGTVDLQGGTAALRIDEVEGPVRYEGSTGTVSIGHALSDVELSGSSGSFDLDQADGNVTATAAHCPIRIGRLTCGQADLTNAAGGIEVGIPAGIHAEVDAESTKGTVRNSLTAQDNPAAATVKIRARTRRDDIVIHQA